MGTSRSFWVNDMDAVAIDTLEEMMESYRERGVHFLFASMKGPIRDLVQRAGWDKKYGNIFQYPSLSHALEEVEKSKKLEDLNRKSPHELDGLKKT